MVLVAGVEVIQEYAIKMPILTLTISNWTDYFKVEMSHYVPRLIMYRPTLFERAAYSDNRLGPISDRFAFGHLSGLPGAQLPREMRFPDPPPTTRVQLERCDGSNADIISLKVSSTGDNFVMYCFLPSR